jgi:2-polyprenyl-6-methoxyphenol hydroxylase-like FAD-dependent oxidoreductase
MCSTSTHILVLLVLPSLSTLACHKLLPSAGLGAVTAMQDAVTLANCLYDMKGLSPLEINEAFDIYKEERYPKVKDQFSASKTNAKLIYGHVKH